jgi:5-methylcytosine-specific restriction endonuclease McrA
VPNGSGHSGHRWRQLRRTVLAARPLLCYFCGHDIDDRLKFPDPASPQVHCKIPVSRGGLIQLENLAPSHMYCNQSAGNKLPITEFIHVEGLDP